MWATGLLVLAHRLCIIPLQLQKEFVLEPEFYLHCGCKHAAFEVIPL